MCQMASSPTCKLRNCQRLQPQLSRELHVQHEFEARSSSFCSGTVCRYQVSTANAVWAHGTALAVKQGWNTRCFTCCSSNNRHLQSRQTDYPPPLRSSSLYCLECSARLQAHQRIAVLFKAAVRPGPTCTAAAKTCRMRIGKVAC